MPIFTSVLLLVSAAVHGPATAAPASGGEAISFERQVRPILKAHCTLCHGEEESPKGGVDLRLRRFMDAPLEGEGVLLVPGHPEKSELVQIIRRGEMPKKGKMLPPDELEILEKWIAQGATTSRPEPQTLGKGSVISEEDRDYWAFQPVQPPPVPFHPSAQVRTPVDAFVLEGLRTQGLEFAPEADRRHLIRRVTVDLTGLLPTPEEVEAFLADPAPDAYENLVDRLLESPAYGERWARHWLDVVGYADSNGYAEADSLRPQAWRYRDYVIRALNEDKPWDEFIQEQLAGDELAGVTHETVQQAVLDPKRRDQLTATAFLRMAPDGTGDTVDDQNLARNQVIAEQLKVTTSSLLGLTVACAQCHDHRYDPITQADYYRLRAVFDPGYHWEAWRTPAQRLYSLYTPEEREQAASIEADARKIEADARAMSKQFLDGIFEVEILKLPEPEREPYRLARATADKDRTPEQKALIKKYPSALALYSLNLYDPKKQKIVDDRMAEAALLRTSKPAEGFIMALTELKGKVPVSKLFNRGDHEQPQETVAPGDLSILAPDDESAGLGAAVAPGGSTGRRLAYAQWLTSGRHPLVARVLVNRFWMHHMGRGLVNTPGDFGRQGEAPSHPELLDWMAGEFVREGWRLKPLHRLILLSHAYRQSAVNESATQQDPENRWYARHRVRRLDAEALRDSLLAATGKLVQQSYGPPSEIGRDPAGRVVVGIDKGTITSAKVESGGQADYRRSIYVQVRRSRPVTVLDAFDAPVMVPNCEVRSQTTVAPQSLLLMNDTFVLETSRLLAARVQAEAPTDLAGQVQRVWSILYSQPASPQDVARSLEFMEAQTAALTAYHHGRPLAKGSPAPDPHQEALASLCQVFFSSNRFLYVE